jgi:hypothetical protein
MAQRDADIQVLSDSLIKEIINAIGLPNTGSTQRTFERLFHKATDRLIASDGFAMDKTIYGRVTFSSNWR